MEALVIDFPLGLGSKTVKGLVTDIQNSSFPERLYMVNNDKLENNITFMAKVIKDTHNPAIGQPLPLLYVCSSSTNLSQATLYIGDNEAWKKLEAEAVNK